MLIFIDDERKKNRADRRLNDELRLRLVEKEFSPEFPCSFVVVNVIIVWNNIIMVLRVINKPKSLQDISTE